MCPVTALPGSHAGATRRHLLAVWNPVIAPDAMEQHLRVLQDAARRVWTFTSIATQ